MIKRFYPAELGIITKLLPPIGAIALPNTLDILRKFQPIGTNQDSKRQIETILTESMFEYSSRL
jgi:hypothetical protein